MKTVKEVSTLTGVSIRTLHYYDSIGLLHPSVTTDAGYRLYDDANLERLQSILLFRELEFPLKDIIRILNSSDFDKEKALTQQIELLELKKKRLEDLICFAREIKTLGVNKMDFKVFDTSKIDAYAAQAKASWGDTDAYKEFEEKSANYSEEQKKTIAVNLMKLFAEFGSLKEKPPADNEVQAMVKRLQDYITEHYYTCTDTILAGLGNAYAAEGAMKENIDNAGGCGTAEFAAKAIAIYCESADR